jgi:hypothetical protein
VDLIARLVELDFGKEQFLAVFAVGYMMFVEDVIIVVIIVLLIR